jgi:hypothetical protein
MVTGNGVEVKVQRFEASLGSQGVGWLVRNYGDREVDVDLEKTYYSTTGRLLGTWTAKGIGLKPGQVKRGGEFISDDPGLWDDFWYGSKAEELRKGEGVGRIDVRVWVREVHPTGGDANASGARTPQAPAEQRQADSLRQEQLASERRRAEQERQQAAEQARQAAERDRQAEAERIASAARAQAAATQQTGQAVAEALGNLIQFFQDKSRERSERERQLAEDRAKLLEYLAGERRQRLEGYRVEDSLESEWNIPLTLRHPGVPGDEMITVRRAWAADCGDNYDGLGYRASYPVFSADGLVMLAGATDQVCLFAVADGRELGRLELPFHNMNGVADCKFEGLAASAGARVVAAGCWNVVVVWTARGTGTTQQIRLNGKPLESCCGRDTWVTAIALSADGRLLAAGTPDSLLRIWDLAERRQRLKLRPPSRVKALAFSSDGRLLAAGTDRTIIVWEAASGRQLQTLDLDSRLGSLHTRERRGGSQVLENSAAGRVRVTFPANGGELDVVSAAGAWGWNTSDWSQSWSLVWDSTFLGNVMGSHGERPPRDIALSPDRRLLAVAGSSIFDPVSALNLADPSARLGLGEVWRRTHFGTAPFGIHNGKNNHGCEAVEFLPDGRGVVCADRGHFRAWAFEKASAGPAGTESSDTLVVLDSAVSWAGFFEASGDTPIPTARRTFSRRFSASTSPMIWWQLDAPGLFLQDEACTYTLRGPDGKIAPGFRESVNFRLQVHTPHRDIGRVGWAERPGALPQGHYRLEFSCGGAQPRKVVESSFVIQ